jgi:two-component system chemotaxis response regulator CheY
MKEHFNIMVVDDERIMRHIVINMTLQAVQLKPVVIDFFEVSNGVDAMSTLGKAGIDLIFLDMNLPLFSGMEILKQIKANEKTADISVIMTTVDASKQNVMDALKNGAADYFLKPFDEVIFSKKVLEVLEKIT